jgi:hypothetical protein
VPQGSRKLQPWAEFSERLRRIFKLNQYLLDRRSNTILVSASADVLKRKTPEPMTLTLLAFEVIGRGLKRTFEKAQLV